VTEAARSSTTASSLGSRGGPAIQGTSPKPRQPVSAVIAS
jgi:hypothetical protein